MKLGIVAGETSGDLLGSLLIQALRRHLPELQFIGIAGPRMQALGAVSLFPMEKLAVRGYVEVLKHYREILGIRRKLIRHFLEDPPDVFVGVDAPDFNLGLEAALKAHGVTTIHYVSPSVWAWRGERVHKIGQAVSRVLTLFPFETPIYEKAGIPVSYVGHPLADVLPEVPDQEGARAQLRVDGAHPVIAMLPGSRQSELDYHAELFVQTARLLAEALPAARFLVPLATSETREKFERALHRAAAQFLPLSILPGQSHRALAAADAALVASGTATLETALLKCPMVITYRVSQLTYRLARRRGYLPYIGLPNVLAGEFIVPELLQDHATPENLAQALTNQITHRRVREALLARFAAIHRSLRQDNAARVAEALLPYLDRRGQAARAEESRDELAHLRGG